MTNEQFEEIMGQLHKLNERVDHLEENSLSREEVHAVIETLQEIAVASDQVIEDRAESGYIILYSLFKGLENRMEDRFISIEARFTNMEDRFTSIEERIVNMEDRFTSIEDRITNMEDRFTSIEDRITNMEDRFTSIEDRITNMEDRFTSIEDRITNMEDRFASIEAKFANQDKKLDIILDSLNYLIQKDQAQDIAIQELQKSVGNG